VNPYHYLKIDAQENEVIAGVQKILNSRIKNGQIQYLIKWDPEDCQPNDTANTWVNAADCDCPDRILEFKGKLSE
jgi:hypothetical protein